MRKGTPHILKTDTTKFTGGKDSHPEPVYMLLSSLSGCLTATTSYVSKELNLKVNSLDITLESHRSQSEVIKKPITDLNVDTGLKEIKGTIKLCVPKTFDDKKLNQLSEIVEKRCPISSLLSSSSCSIDLKWSILPTPTKINIYGAGLAGLSTLYNLLLLNPNLDITIYSKSEIGKGGGTAVSGGLFHPYTPKGKLTAENEFDFEFGMELVRRCMKVNPKVVRTDIIYKTALREEDFEGLENTGCEIIDKDEFKNLTGCESILGGVKLDRGVIIEPTIYCSTLFKICNDLSVLGVKYIVKDVDLEKVGKLEEGIVNVFAGGGEMLYNRRFESLECEPIVGRSLKFSKNDGEEKDEPSFGIISGKYISPVSGGTVVGATNEIGEGLDDDEDVYENIKKKAFNLRPELFDNPHYSITKGVRANTKRTNKGRIPIVEYLGENEWVFTGLGSRGFLGHAKWGRKCARLILGEDCDD